MRARLIFPLACLLLAGCNSLSLPGWLAGPEDPPLPGERIAVLPQESSVKADDTIASLEVTVPDATPQADWPQDGGNAANRTGNITYGGNYRKDASATVAGGDDFEGVLVPPPVAAEDKVFAMDAKGRISAHAMKNLSEAWEYKGLMDEDEADALGGGLAYDAGVLYALTGRGDVAAISPPKGQEIWKAAIGIPLRSAPRVAGGVLYALSTDNQLFALDAATGKQLWSHRGIGETASYLSLVTPAATEDTVIAPYSSGEIKALKSGSGDEAWSDSLALSRRTTAANIFTGIDANPTLANGMVYAVSNGGLMAATDLSNGRRAWEQDISSTNAVLAVGDFLYVLSSESELVCLRALDGRIRWVKQLERYADTDKKKPRVWSGPLMLDGKLVVTGAHGVLAGYSPKDGAPLFEKDIPDGIYSAPIVAGNTLYAVTKDATLVAIR